MLKYFSKAELYSKHYIFLLCLQALCSTLQDQHFRLCLEKNAFS